MNGQSPSPSPSELQSSQNLGIADLKNEGKRICKVEYVDEATGFFHVIDVETNLKYRIYRTHFAFLKPPTKPTP